MSDGAPEPGAGGLAGHLNRKLSELLLLLFNHKSAGSFGALVGFAIAVIFTRKLLRPTPRNRPKRRTPPTAGVEAVSGPETYASDLGPDDWEVIEGSGSSIELTVGQIARRKLGGCRKMTCQLLGVILEERTPEELQSHATVRLSVVDVLLEITKFCNLYLMETVLDDESEGRVLSALENAGLFETGGLIKDKMYDTTAAYCLFTLTMLLQPSRTAMITACYVLFCSTEIGRSSFVRQLEADWHVDTNLEIVSQLARFIRYQLHIAPISSVQIAPNVFTSASLEQYLSCL